MVIGNISMIGVPCLFIPFKTKTPLIIDPYCPLTCQILFQFFKMIAIWNFQVYQVNCRIEHPAEKEVSNDYFRTVGKLLLEKRGQPAR